MEKFTIFVVYSLIGNDYTERPRFNCTHKLYDSAEEAIKAVANEIEIEYNNKNYIGLKVTLPKIKDGWISNGSFECAYIFGPRVHYDIYITEVK